jgi:hypothetical protein
MVVTGRKVIAALLALRALTNLAKPFGSGSGFVIAGELYHGAATTIVAPLVGVMMLVYAYGLWHARSFAWTLGTIYAMFATVNIIRFPLLEGIPAAYPPWTYIFYAIPGIAIPWLALWLLGKSGGANAVASVNR